MTKTVRVRMAVAVDEKGGWYAAGWPTDHESDIVSYVDQTMCGFTDWFWLEADIPIPEPQVIEAEVKPA